MTRRNDPPGPRICACPGWIQVTYHLSLPAGTSYVKAVFPGGLQNAWDPQIGNVTYTYR